jgi:acyl carrier protein
MPMKRTQLLTTCLTLGFAMTSCDKLRNEKGASAGKETAAVGQRDAVVVARVKKEIGEILGKSPDSIRVTDQFIRDLGADSLDTVEIVMAIEEVFNIAIADADAEKLIAVGDLIDYVTAKMKSVPVDAGKKNKSETSYDVAGIYASMRSMILNLDAEQIGELKDKPVWAVLMETGYPEAAVTLVAVADGAASLYFSNGGGIIGAGEHDNVRPVSLGFVKMAEGYLADMKKVEEFPIATPGNTTFYVVTPQGVFTRTAKENDLGEERDQLSKFFYQGQNLITQMRIAEEKRAAGNPPGGQP